MAKSWDLPTKATAYTQSYLCNKKENEIVIQNLRIGLNAW